MPRARAAGRAHGVFGVVTRAAPSALRMRVLFADEVLVGLRQPGVRWEGCPVERELRRNLVDHDRVLVELRELRLRLAVALEDVEVNVLLRPALRLGEVAVDDG